MKKPTTSTARSKSDRYIYENTGLVEALVTLGALVLVMGAVVMELTS